MIATMTLQKHHNDKGANDLKIELNKQEVHRAIQEYIFKKIGDTAYIESLEIMRDVSYERPYSVEYDFILTEVKE